MIENPVWDRYELSTQSKNVIRYYEDKLNAGGSIFLPKYPGTPKYFIESIFGEIFMEIRHHLNLMYSWGEYSAGGYFILNKIYDPKVELYYTVHLFSTWHQGYELQRYNNTKNELCCWSDSDEISGLRHLVNGLARIEVSDRENQLVKIIEGEVYEGLPSGFARIIDGFAVSQFLGYLHGDTAWNKGLFFQDFHLMYTGFWEDRFYFEEPLHIYDFEDFWADWPVFDDFVVEDDWFECIHLSNGDCVHPEEYQYICEEDPSLCYEECYTLTTGDCVAEEDYWRTCEEDPSLCTYDDDLQCFHISTTDETCLSEDEYHSYCEEHPVECGWHDVTCYELTNGDCVHPDDYE